MTVISRISPDGVLKTNVELDEVSFTSIKTGPAGVFAAEFDEVSLSTSTSISGYYYDIQPADRNKLTLRSTAVYTTASLVSWSSLPIWNNGLTVGSEITVELTSGDTYFLGNITSYEGTSTVTITNPINHSIGFVYLNQPPVQGRLYTGVEQTPTNFTAERKRSNGVYQVTGFFDEVSGIS
jgi:hypothetical protein